jgi:hypothetical protein
MSASIKFVGTHQALKDRLLLLGIDGEWLQQPHMVWMFKCRDGAGLHWSQTKGTVWFDGPPATKAILRAKVEALLASDRLNDDVTIFVVHGCDQSTREQLKSSFRRLGLEPKVLAVAG